MCQEPARRLESGEYTLGKILLYLLVLVHYWTNVKVEFGRYVT